MGLQEALNHLRLNQQGGAGPAFAAFMESALFQDLTDAQKEYLYTIYRRASSIELSPAQESNLRDIAHEDRPEGNDDAFRHLASLYLRSVLYDEDIHAGGDEMWHYFTTAIISAAAYDKLGLTVELE